MKPMSTKRFPLGEGFFLVLTTALFLLLGGLGLFFFGREELRIQERFELIAENMGDRMLREWQSGSLTELPPGIIGFSVRKSGQSVFTLGSFPPRIPSAPPFPRREPREPGSFRRPQGVAFFPLRDGQQYLLWKSIPLAQVERRREDPLQYILYLDAADLTNRLDFWSMARFLGPIVILVLYASFLLYFFRVRKLRKDLAEREEQVRASEITRTLSHELKNPLAAIRLQNGLLKRQFGKVEEISIIEEEVGRITHLMERMGDYLKNPQGSPQLLDIREEINKIKERLEIPLVLKNLPQILYFDPMIFRLIMENLIQNAWQAQEKTSQDPITIQGYQKDTETTLEVLDSGTGIPEGLQEKIFEPFFTTRTRGSGIGLALVRRFMESSGGKVQGGNQKNGGSCFTLRFPKAPPKMPRKAMTQESPNEKGKKELQ